MILGLLPLLLARPARIQALELCSAIHNDLQAGEHIIWLDQAAMAGEGFMLSLIGRWRASCNCVSVFASSIMLVTNLQVANPTFGKNLHENWCADDPVLIPSMPDEESQWADLAG